LAGIYAILKASNQRLLLANMLSSLLHKNALLGLALLLAICCGCGPKLPAPQMTSDGMQFSYFAPEAKSVSIAGSFNHWDPDQAGLTGPSKKGTWTIVLPLAPGRYEYRFVINSREWVLDPSVPAVDDGLGGRNSVVEVGR
jgi:1,4-alpha-glucan branching enzyme